MFTGIITDIGTIIDIKKFGDIRARIGTKYLINTINLGASIACDGTCLTVIETGETDGTSWFDIEISAETISKTNILRQRNPWKTGRKINLERALKLGEELGGHLVSGHIDGIATVTDLIDEGDSTRIEMELPSNLKKFIAPKGSVTLNGTSLTINHVTNTCFDINLIPHTKKHTTWGDIIIGDQINLEIDTLARYVARLHDMKDLVTR